MWLKHRGLERPAGNDAGRISRVDIMRLLGHFKVFGIYPRMMFWGETLKSFLFQAIWETLHTVVISRRFTVHINIFKILRIHAMKKPF